jgi:hypothetical protein
MSWTVRRRRRRGKYRIVIFYNSKEVAELKWSPKEGLTVPRVLELLQERPEEVIYRAPPKSKERLKKAVARERMKELREYRKKANTLFVPYIFREWGESKSHKKRTEVTFDVFFVTKEDPIFHDENEDTILEIFTKYLREAVKEFIDSLEINPEFQEWIMDLIEEASCNISEEGVKPVRMKHPPRKIKLATVYEWAVVNKGNKYFKTPKKKRPTSFMVEAQFFIEVNGKRYDYSFDFERVVVDELLDAIDHMKVVL